LSGDIGKRGAMFEVYTKFSIKMIFSKSFGYAIRGIVYVSAMNSEKEKIQLNEIAVKLSIPRYFLAKIMKRMVKAGILSSVKGPFGGFSVNEQTATTTLLTLYKLTDGKEQFNTCVLQLRKCNAIHPCPLHDRLQSHKNNLVELLESTTIHDLLKKNNPAFIRSLSTF
jgi:Rrf2 family transcriptional regulator, iron-sulfur cluster assembly transcription factor